MAPGRRVVPVPWTGMQIGAVTLKSDLTRSGLFSTSKNVAGKTVLGVPKLEKKIT